jgi:uncharacterized protein
VAKPSPPQQHAKGQRQALDQHWLAYLATGGEAGDGHLIADVGSFRAGIAAFNAGKFFEAHESFEDAWQVTPYPDRLIGLGLAKLSAALVRAQRGEGKPTHKVMRDATRVLAGLPDVYARVDLGDLLRALIEQGKANALAPAELKIVVKE